ncbi:MAG TPA: ORF6N domain-containing protein [Verrucomicrobiae bacterium]|nr:ORF6N domain-containing protein [Verrucomicrobiae bacterium]
MPKLTSQERAMTKKEAMVRAERIESRILLIRGQRVMLDSDLAELYGASRRMAARLPGCPN